MPNNLLPNGNGQVAADPDTVTSSMDLGSLPGAVAGGAIGYGLSKAGVPGEVTSAVSAAASSKSFSDLQDSLLSSLANITGREVAERVAPGVPGLPSLGGALASEATKDNPNFGAAALSSGIKSGAALVGTMLGGPIGGFIGGVLSSYAVKSSLDDGWLGDLTDARSYETSRDRAEALGFSRDQTGDAAGVQAGRDAFADAGYSGLDPGVSKDSGVGLSPGTSDLEGGVARAGRDSLMGYMDRESERSGDDGGDGPGGVGTAAGDAGGARGGGSEGNSGYW